MSEEKVRDIIGELSDRSVCGSSTLERLGHRAWSRPNVAVSSRLYRQYRVPDPWDPEATREEIPVGLGPVSLRLGEQRRQPAPHLKPKPPKEKKKSLAERARAKHRPPRLPEPKKPATKAAAAPAPPKAGTPLAAKQEAEAARAAEVAARMRAAEAARGPRPMRRRSRGDDEADSGSSSIRLPVRPDISPDAIPDKPENADAQPARPAQPSRSTGRSDAGRFRMPRAAMNRAPVVRTERAQEAERKGGEVEPPEQPPPRQRAMPSIGGGGMDDLFGAAAQMGRVSLRPSKKDEEESE